ncbi:MAG: SbmA/BacA-like family transporter, partial [bacterium]|nr:SbmA/BacA-like family transporter [bacterium]
MNSIRSTLATVWRIAIPYFRSEDKWAGRALLAAVVSIELALVAIDVLLNQWSNRFYTGLQEKNWDVFVREIGYFCVIAACFIALAVYQLYLNQWLQIRWRRWLTRHYLGEWMDGANHYRMQLQGDAADNPDQRIADDVRLFVERTLDIGLNLLNSVVTLFSFVIILWGLSAAAPLHLFGQEFAIPGYLVWGALIYAIFGTALTQWIGSPLVMLDFRQQRFEADFRFNLVRARENSEQIALLRGENAERQKLWERFNNVVENWYGIMSRTKRLTAFTASYAQAAVVFPYILVAPAFFAGKIQLGGLTQTASAFGSVQKALSIFVTIYRTLADWRAIVARLDGFEASIAAAAQLAASRESIGVVASDGGKTIDLKALTVHLPNGTPLVSADGFSLRAGERTLLTGPSGSGKSTL